jgi:hypothetical protein
MAKGSFNVLPVVRRWWAGDGRERKLAYFVLPIVVGAGLALLSVEAKNLGSLETGSIFLSGLLLTIMFQVYGWTSDAGTMLDDASTNLSAAWERTKARRRLRLIGRLYDSLAWATLVSFTLTIALVGVAATQPKEHRVLITAVAGAIGVHLLVVLLAVISRLFNVTRSIVNEHQDKTKEKG